MQLAIDGHKIKCGLASLHACQKVEHRAQEVGNLQFRLRASGAHLTRPTIFLAWKWGTGDNIFNPMTIQQYQLLGIERVESEGTWRGNSSTRSLHEYE